MAIEIERRFRIDVAHLQRVETQLPGGVLIEQGYLSFEPCVRVRKASDDTASLTVKGPGLFERLEFPYPIPLGDALAMWPLAKATIAKTRYKLKYDILWEIDEFHGPHEGLWIAEVELPHVMQRFDRPTWLRKEVTNDERYQNVYLAQHPERFWQDT